MFAKEEQRYGRNKNTSVDHSYIESGAYRKKFDEITENKKLSKLLYGLAKRMLFHRTGTLFEDMYWIDTTNSTVVCEVTESLVESKIRYTEKIKKVISTHDSLLTIHSHPNSYPPSIDDLNSAYLNGYLAGIVCCHNGDVFVYSSHELIQETSYYFLL